MGCPPANSISIYTNGIALAAAARCSIAILPLRKPQTERCDTVKLPASVCEHLNDAICYYERLVPTQSPKLYEFCVISVANSSGSVCITIGYYWHAGSLQGIHKHNQRADSRAEFLCIKWP